MIATPNLAAIANDYIQRFRESARLELRHYGKQRSLHDAIREAALSRLSNGSRHPHQYRIPEQVLSAAEKTLQGMARRLSKSSSFSDLYSWIEKAIGPVRGVGALTTYDIAHRIGAFLTLEPELVYLHAGTKDGARAIGLKGSAIEVAQLPLELRCLSAAELEDCLCIYKRDLQAFRMGSHSGISDRCDTRRRRRPACAT